MIVTPTAIFALTISEIFNYEGGVSLVLAGPVLIGLVAWYLIEKYLNVFPVMI